MNNFLVSSYNPDVLNCLANLSNDEVFTPPEIANKMLDMLPNEIWKDKNATFLDPAAKSGVFLREIAKRLIEGLKDEIPDLQERIDHIFHKQLFGIAITELTSLLSRRSVYCSKYPNSKYSISHFPDYEGNIRFRRCEHDWETKRVKEQNGTTKEKKYCKFCGASGDEFERGEELETHAYEWIHTLKPEEIFKMKFDVIIGNPPYQLETGGAGKQAKPIYNLFIEQAIKLQPRFLVMITPSRWFSGGMGLDSFRDMMLKNQHLKEIVDYSNSKDCFAGLSIGGGVNYFLWSRDYVGDCKFTNFNSGESDTEVRPLNEFPVLVRYNKAVDIIHKVKGKKEGLLSEIISPLMPYGLNTNYRGKKSKDNKTDLVLHSSKDITYIRPNEITKGFETVDKYKVLISKTSAEHAGEPAKDGRFRVLTSSLKVIGPGEVCTHSYFTIGTFAEKAQAKNLEAYLKTKFVRFLILQSLSSINLSKLVFSFVPIQNFDVLWTDEMLYEKYGITKSEQDFIDSMIKPFEE